MLGENSNPGQSTPFAFSPVVQTPSGGWDVGSLADYLGVPPGVTAFNLGFANNSGAVEGVSALPFRCYNLIWNEYYRDEYLQATPAEVPAGGGESPDSPNNYVLQNCAWQKDYLTTSRPYEALGPQVTLPLGTTAPVELSGNTPYNPWVRS